MPADDPLTRYRVMAPLGEGGQATTFRGIDLDTNREVAIKILSLKNVKAWKAFDLFEREVEVLRGLDHPGIPRYIDNYSVESSGDFFLVMELVEGRPLQEFVAGKSRLKAAELRDLFGQALDILEYLHGLAPPVIHRDIKPANLIRRYDGKLQLVDFGGVRKAFATEGASTVVGTFGYMAPEQLSGQASPATDLYALAATVLALLTGHSADKLPHDGLRFDLSQIKLVPPFDRVLPGMLEPEPKQRLDSVAAVRTALSRPAASAKPRESSSSTARPRQRSSRALVKVPDEAKELAKATGVVGFLVWVVASLASGLLLVFEAVLLPLFFQLVTALQNRPRDDPRRAAFKRDYEDFKGKVRSTRNTAGYIAGKTRPKPD